MKVIGLTGGIATGKSTVARMFERLGARLLDADQIAREVVEPGRPAFEKLVAAFGPDLLGEDGVIDRRRLRRIVFDNPEHRTRLERIVHPEVIKETASRLHREREARTSLVVYEAALLVETGMYRLFDALVVTNCDTDLQVKRLKARDGVSDAEARAVLENQADPASRLALATHVLDTNPSFDDVRKQVSDLWALFTDPDATP